MPKEFWDLEEKKGYVIANVNGSNYYILDNRKHMATAAEIFKRIDYFIMDLSSYLSTNFHKVPPELKPGIMILIMMHPHKQRLYELPEDSQFIGLCKPKGVKTNKNLPPIGKDKYLKATAKFLYIQIRNPDGTFKTGIEIEDIVIHELAHTAANHVTWRNDNHGKDYKQYHDFLKRLYK